MTIAALSQIADPAACPRLVLKVGSALLVERGGTLRRDWLKALAGEIAEARARGQQVVVVSSGAIALGAARLGLTAGGRANLADAQAAAAVGQIELAGAWAELLGQQGLVAAQLLLTLDDLEDRRRYLNASSTLARLLDQGAVPVVNEISTVSPVVLPSDSASDSLSAIVSSAAGGLTGDVVEVEDLAELCRVGGRPEHLAAVGAEHET